jgi:HlyD family secretion protein
MPRRHRPEPDGARTHADASPAGDLQWPEGSDSFGWHAPCFLPARRLITLDRPLDTAVRRRALARRIAVPAGTLLLVALALSWGLGWLRPSVARAAVRTARVEVGPIEATITAAGTVVPEVEQVISSPIDARVVRILKRAGAAVKAGDAILELDTLPQQVAVARLRQLVALKENQLGRATLDLDARLTDLESQRQIKQLQLAAFRARLGRSRELHQGGLVSKEELQQSELAVSQAEVESTRIEGEQRAARASTAAALDGLRMELATARTEASEAERLLRLAALRAERDGVVTWTLTEEGGTIQRGEAVARVADLTSFRVDATLSDVHARSVAIGQPVVVRAADDQYAGTVSNVLPKVENGVMTIQVALANSRNPLLRSNLRVDVLIITARKSRVLRLARGPFADGAGAREAFVVRGASAVRTSVELGLASFDHFEVVKGLAEGDEVIVSDMRNYQHLKEVRLR